MADKQTCPTCGQQILTDPNWLVTWFKGGQIIKAKVENETLARGYAAGLIGKKGISGVEVEKLQGQHEPLLALKAIYDEQGACWSRHTLEEPSDQHLSVTVKDGKIDTIA